MRNPATPRPVPVSDPFALVLAFSGLLTACGSGDARTWSGAMDTLSSGVVEVRNTDGPGLFGQVYSFDVDAWGRIFVLDD